MEVLHPRERIGVEQDQISVIARLDQPDCVAPVEIVGGVHRRHLQDRQRLDPRIGQLAEFLLQRQAGAEIGAAVGADDHPHARIVQQFRQRELARIDVAIGLPHLGRTRLPHVRHLAPATHALARQIVQHLVVFIIGRVGEGLGAQPHQSRALPAAVLGEMAGHVLGPGAAEALARVAQAIDVRLLRESRRVDQHPLELLHDDPFHERDLERWQLDDVAAIAFRAQFLLVVRAAHPDRAARPQVLDRAEARCRRLDRIGAFLQMAEHRNTDPSPLIHRREEGIGVGEAHFHEIRALRLLPPHFLPRDVGRRGVERGEDRARRL